MERISQFARPVHSPCAGLGGRPQGAFFVVSAPCTDGGCPRGLAGNNFETEAEALTWLLGESDQPLK